MQNVKKLGFCVVPALYTGNNDKGSLLVKMAKVQLSFVAISKKKYEIIRLPTSHSFRVLRHMYQWYIIKILVSS